jgi:hypothetical protein
MGSKDLRVKRREPSQLLCISLVALAIAWPRSHRGERTRSAIDLAQRRSPEASSTSDIAILLERAVMAPTSPKVDPDRHLELGLPAWNFGDEVVALASSWEQSLRPDPKGLLIPFIITIPGSLVSTMFRQELVAGSAIHSRLISCFLSI